MKSFKVHYSSLSKFRSELMGIDDYNMSCECLWCFYAICSFKYLQLWKFWSCDIPACFRYWSFF